MQKCEQTNENVETQKWKEINEEDGKAALKKSHKWRSPGIDKLPNF